MGGGVIKSHMAPLLRVTNQHMVAIIVSISYSVSWENVDPPRKNMRNFLTFLCHGFIIFETDTAPHRD